jgi:hypothetical protein
MREKRQRWNLATLYGITLEDLDRMMKAQAGRCAICNEPIRIDQPRGINVDHCHSSLKVRGVLCRCCNHLLGHAKDDPRILRKAAQYLDTSRGISGVQGPVL